MRLVVADTGPINYLVLIGAIEVLPKLFEQILVPAAVCNELSHADAPPPVRAFISRMPAWLEIRPNPDRGDDTAIDRPWTKASGSNRACHINRCRSDNDG
jgi:predicted nucleic acid-binding protein